MDILMLGVTNLKNPGPSLILENYLWKKQENIPTPLENQNSIWQREIQHYDWVGFWMGLKYPIGLAQAKAEYVSVCRCGWEVTGNSAAQMYAYPLNHHTVIRESFLWVLFLKCLCKNANTLPRSNGTLSHL